MPGGGAPGGGGGGAGAGAPNMDQIRQMGQMMGGMGGGPPGAGGGAASAAAAGGADANLKTLMKYVPDTLNQATGLDVKAVSGDKSNLTGVKLLQEFAILFDVLARGGIKQNQVEYIIAGCNRKTNQQLIVVRTSAALEGAGKKMGVGESVAVGKQKMFLLPSGPEKNAIAVPEPKVLLVGRAATVQAALSGPAKGAVSGGVEAMAQPSAFYWIAGDAEAAKKRMEGSDFPLLQDYAAEGTRMIGYAMGVGGSPEGAASESGGPGPGGFGGPPGGRPGGGPMVGSASNGAGGGPPPGMMPGGPGGAGGASGGAATAANKARINAVFGMVFQSEGLAVAAETRLNELFKKYAPRQSGPGGMGGMGPGGMGPGMGPGGMGPGGPGGGGGGPSPSAPPPPPPNITRLVLPELSLDDLKLPRLVEPMPAVDVAGETILKQQPGGPPGGAPPSGPPGGMGPGGMGPMGPGGMGPGMGGMPGMPGGGNQNDEKLITATNQRRSENIRLTMSIPNRPDLGVVFVEKAYNDAIQAMGATALPDGIFAGSLTAMRSGYDKIVAAKPGGLKGVKRMGEDEPIWVGYSWMTEILPFIDYNDLYLQFDQTKPWIDKSNRVHAYTVIPAFVNPADPNVQWNGLPYDGVGLTHFAGMAGLEDKRNVVAADLPRTDPRAGIFGYDEIVPLDSIKDGKAQTIMLIGSGKSSAPWIQGGGGTVRGARAPFFDKFHGFGSAGLATPGVYVMMADGSARIINADIDPEVFKAMCTIQGAETVDMQKFLTQSE